MVKSLLKQSSLLLLALLLGGSLTASAGEASFAPSDFTGQGTSGTGSVITATVDGVTFSCDKGYGTTQVRCYSGSTITISSTVSTITAISFTFSGSNNGGLETSYTGLSTNTWTQALTSQARFTQIKVTYETSDSRTVVATIGDLTPTEVVNGDDDFFTCDVTYSTGATGIVKYESSDDDILMVYTDGEYLAQAAGSVKVTVTVTPDDDTNFREVSKEFTVTVTKAPHVAAFNEVFYESFDKCDGTGGNDGQWSGSIASNTLTPDNDENWSFDNGSGANECAKLGSGSKKGSASFKLSLNPGTYELNFKAAAWNTNSENTTIQVLDKDENALYVIDNNNNIEEYAQLTKGEFADYYCYVTVVEAGEQTITFQAITASNNRFFLDEVQLLAIDQTKDVTSYGWATYITQYGSTFDPGTAYAVTAVGADQQTITISEVTEAKAGTPLLLKGAGQTITATVADTDVDPSNMLIVYNGSITGYPYVLAQDGDGAGFKQWTGDESKLNGRVVLPLDFAQPSSARLMRIVEGGATGISTVETVVMGGNNCFDLQGRRVAQPRKGLYIVDGKKMVIK